MPQTITQALVRDHRVAQADLARALGSPRMMPTLYPKIADEVRRHSSAEEATLYQALDQIPGERPTVASLEDSHKQIAALLGMLDRTPYGDAAFLPTLRRVQQLLNAHISFEETTVFPYTDRTLPLARRVALGQRYNLRMGIAPKKKNISILLPSLSSASARTPNPCGCEKANPPRVAKPKRVRRWYHHMFGGVGALLR